MLCLDSDGVFFAFVDHVTSLTGQHPDSMNDDDMWRRINAAPDFWPTMPLLPGALEFWDAVKHVNPLVITGCPKTNLEHAAFHKVAAWDRHFGHKRVITCLSRDKALHMERPGDWLVDDMAKNCKKWERAGGRAYRYDGDWQKCVAFLTKQGVL